MNVCYNCAISLNLKQANEFGMRGHYDTCEVCCREERNIMFEKAHLYIGMHEVEGVSHPHLVISDQEITEDDFHEKFVTWKILIGSVIVKFSKAKSIVRERISWRLKRMVHGMEIPEKFAFVEEHGIADERYYATKKRGFASSIHFDIDGLFRRSPIIDENIEKFVELCNTAPLGDLSLEDISEGGAEVEYISLDDMWDCKREFKEIAAGYEGLRFVNEPCIEHFIDRSPRKIDAEFFVSK